MKGDGPLYTATTRSFRDVRMWGSRALWSVVDQALFAGANFAIMVLLARWMAPADYGSFAMGYAVLLLIGAIHTAFWIEPMLVFGGGRYRAFFFSYVRVLVRGHWLFSAGLAVCCLAAAAILHSSRMPAMASSSIGLAIAGPFTLFLWLARRISYVEIQPHKAVMAGALYLLLALPIVFLFAEVGWLSPAAMLVASGLSALAAGVCAFSQAMCAAPKDTAAVSCGDIVVVHSRYGRWAVVSSAMSWVPIHSPFLLLPIVSGLDETGGLRAAMNVILPAIHANIALSFVLLPLLASMKRVYARDEVLVVRSVVVFLVANFCYGGAVILFSEGVLDAFYAGKYVLTATQTLALAAIPIAHSMNLVFTSSLKANGDSKAVAVGHSAGAILLGLSWLVPLGQTGLTQAILMTLACNLYFAATSFAAWLLSGRKRLG